MEPVNYPKAREADIALLLEGSYPFIKGGVSSWVNQIIRAFPEYTFAAIFLGSRESDYNGVCYDLPENLVHLSVNYMFDDIYEEPVAACQGNKQGFEAIDKLHEWFKSSNHKEMKMPDMAKNLSFYLNPTTGVDQKQFLFSKEAWEYICKSYMDNCTDPSFVDYFWTVRNIHAPIWQLAKIARTAPTVKVIHTISTGYAGFLGTLLEYRDKLPFIISEHGIYTKERRIDLYQTQWIKENTSKLQSDPSEISYFRKMWIRFFESLASIAYDASTDIVSLYKGAQVQQLADGASENRTQIIPNGIDIDKFKDIRKKCTSLKDLPKVITLIGRVVPLKDIKTLIRAVNVVLTQKPDFEIWVVGPEDEDLEYVKECKDLAKSLGILNKIKFKGFQDTHEVLSQSSLMVLSSISEGLPLVLLEAFAAGVPAVTTNVGACAELIDGKDDEDKKLGSAGIVVDIADPEALGDAILTMVSDIKIWQQAQAAAIARVERYYDQKDLFTSYRNLYQKAMETK